MANRGEFYKGKSRRRHNYIVIPAAILLLLVSAVVVLFYSLQKYAVITKDEVRVVMTGTQTETLAQEQQESAEEAITAEATITYLDPDYSDIQQTVDGDVEELRAIFVPSSNISGEQLDAYASRLSSGNALVIEMKPVTGTLMWTSTSEAAVNYGLNQEAGVTQYMQSYVQSLKDRGVYLVAQISCCLDGRYSTYSTTVALRNSYGNNYVDDSGSWLDPYNQNVRDYVVDMVRELWDMGFDEVVLADVMHPVVTDDPETQFIYSRQMSSPQSPMNAVCGFALYVSQQLQEEKAGKLSIYVNSATALARLDTANGQDAALFFKLYDRVFYITDKFTYTYNCQDVEDEVTVGKLADRFVPVVYNYLPDNTSWVLIDVDEE